MFRDRRVGRVGVGVRICVGISVGVGVGVVEYQLMQTDDGVRTQTYRPNAAGI